MTLSDLIEKHLIGYLKDGRAIYVVKQPDGTWIEKYEDHSMTQTSREEWEDKYEHLWSSLVMVADRHDASKLMADFIKSLLQKEYQRGRDEGFNLAKFEARAKCVVIGTTEEAQKIFDAIGDITQPTQEKQ